MKVKIYIPDEDAYGEIISRGAYTSFVKYSVGGISYETTLLNEDFVIIKEEEEL